MNLIPLTKQQAEHAKRWLQKRLRFKDWNINLALCDEPPADINAIPNTMGYQASLPHCKRARVWVSNSRSIAAGETSLSTLFHEMLHVAVADIGYECKLTSQAEFLINQLSYICEAAYLAEQSSRREIAHVKEQALRRGCRRGPRSEKETK